MTHLPPSEAAALVSVIIPVHNGERYLQECLSSVVAQTWRPLDVIVVDDGSTDRSAAIAEGVEGVTIIRQANAGVAAARNAGIAAARADCIALLDQDDVWLPRKLEAQMELLRASPLLDYVLTRQERFVEPGHALPSWIRPGHVDTVLGGFEPSAVLFRRAALARVGPFDPRFVVASDAEWFFRATDAGLRTAFVEEPLLRRRIHDQNNSRFTERWTAEARLIALESIRRKRRQTETTRTS